MCFSSHLGHKTKLNNRNLETAVDDHGDSYEPRSVAKQRWETAVSSTKNMVIAQIDLHQYKTNEIKVDVRGMKIFVKGRHITERKNGYDASEFERFYAVPKGVDPRRVSTRYSDDMLIIEAQRQGKKKR